MGAQRQMTEQHEHTWWPTFRQEPQPWTCEQQGDRVVVTFTTRIYAERAGCYCGETRDLEPDERRWVANTIA
jgi:hypothetical protein